MKDWRTIADGIIQANSKVTPQGALCLNAEALSIGIAHSMEMAYEEGKNAPTVSYGPAPGKPVLVSDKWLEDINNKIAQINQRLNHMEGMQRGFADIVTAQAVRLDEQERHMKKVQEIAFKVQAGWTEANVKKWAAENLEPKE